MAPNPPSWRCGSGRGLRIGTEERERETGSNPVANQLLSFHQSHQGSIGMVSIIRPWLSVSVPEVFSEERHPSDVTGVKQLSV